MARTKTTSNPRAIMDSLGKLSQRPHKTKSGGETRKPGPRLKARRAKNTEKGYFPNPNVTIKAKELFLRKTENAVSYATVKDKDDIARQAKISYAQGLIDAGVVLKLIESAYATDLLRRIQVSI